MTTPKKSSPAAAGFAPAKKETQRRQVTLASGGTLGFSLDVNTLALTSEDRTFIFQIVDQLDAYEQAQKAKAAAAG